MWRTVPALLAQRGAAVELREAGGGDEGRAARGLVARVEGAGGEPEVDEVAEARRVACVRG